VENHKRLKKAYAACAECVEMDTCEKLRPAGEMALKGLRKIRAMGVDKWAEEMQKKVDAGYCELDERMK